MPGRARVRFACDRGVIVGTSEGKCRTGYCTSVSRFPVALFSEEDLHREPGTGREEDNRQGEKERVRQGRATGRTQRRQTGNNGELPLYLECVSV